MMLTPEQLRNMRQAANGLWKVEFDGRGIRQIVAHIDAQQARIAELEQQFASANNFAGCAAHELERVQLRQAQLEQDSANAAAAERERIKAICGDVIDEWFNCAGGADEVLRRIEEYEQNGEAKP